MEKTKVKFLLIAILLDFFQNCTSQCQIPTIDALFVVDGTPAVINQFEFDKIKSFVVAVTTRMTISALDSRVGFIQFTPMARPEFYSNIYMERSRIVSAVGAAPYRPCQNIIECYGSTAANSSVTHVAELGMSPAAGNRPNVADVLIIVTTGIYKPLTKPSPLTSVLPNSPRYVFVVKIGSAAANAVNDYNVPYAQSVTEIQPAALNPDFLVYLIEPLCEAINTELQKPVKTITSTSATGANGGAIGVAGVREPTSCTLPILLILLIFLLFFIILAYVLWRLTKRNNELQAKVNEMSKWAESQRGKGVQATRGPNSGYDKNGFNYQQFINEGGERKYTAKAMQTLQNGWQRTANTAASLYSKVSGKERATSSMMDKEQEANKRRKGADTTVVDLDGDVENPEDNLNEENAKGNSGSDADAELDEEDKTDSDKARRKRFHQRQSSWQSLILPASSRVSSSGSSIRSRRNAQTSNENEPENQQNLSSTDGDSLPEDEGFDEDIEEYRKQMVKTNSVLKKEIEIKLKPHHLPQKKVKPATKTKPFSFLNKKQEHVRQPKSHAHPLQSQLTKTNDKIEKSSTTILKGNKVTAKPNANKTQAKNINYVLGENIISSRESIQKLPNAQQSRPNQNFQNQFSESDFPNPEVYSIEVPKKNQRDQGEAQKLENLIRNPKKIEISPKRSPKSHKEALETGVNEPKRSRSSEEEIERESKLNRIGKDSNEVTSDLKKGNDAILQNEENKFSILSKIARTICTPSQYLRKNLKKNTILEVGQELEGLPNREKSLFLLHPMTNKPMEKVLHRNFVIRDDFENTLLDLDVETKVKYNMKQHHHRKLNSQDINKISRPQSGDSIRSTDSQHIPGNEDLLKRSHSTFKLLPSRHFPLSEQRVQDKRAIKNSADRRVTPTGTPEILRQSFIMKKENDGDDDGRITTTRMGMDTPALMDELDQENEKHNIHQVPKTAHPSNHLPAMDLLLLVDNSGSIGNHNFHRVKEFCSALIDDINVSPGKSRVGIILFNTEPTVYLNMDRYFTNAAIKGSVDRMPYMGGGTFMGKALDFATDILVQTHGQKKPKKPPKNPKLQVLIVISDGFTEDAVESAGRRCSQLTYARIAAVGVKDHQKEKLQSVTRDSKSIFLLSDSEELSTWLFRQQFSWEQEWLPRGHNNE